jgi:hypothetical protein
VHLFCPLYLSLVPPILFFVRLTVKRNSNFTSATSCRSCLPAIILVGTGGNKENLLGAGMDSLYFRISVETRSVFSWKPRINLNYI